MSIGTAFYAIVILIGLFPYVTLYNFGTDIQPWFVLLASIIFILDIKRSYNIYILYLAIPCVFSLFLFVAGNDFFNSARSFLGYLTIAITPWIVLQLLRKNKNILVSLLKISSLLYFFVAVVQIALDKSFLTSLISRLSTTTDRGVVSLSPEPTFYGLICLFLILALSVDGSHKKTIKLNAIQILFFAQSSMVIVLGAVYALYALLLNFKIRYLFFIVILTILSYFIYELLSNSNIRFLNIINIINKTASSPDSIIYADASINDRVSAIFFSIKGFFDNYAMPNGFGTYGDYLKLNLPQQDFFWYVAVQDRIMSYYGSILFELGLVGLIIPVVYSMIVYKAYRHNFKNMLVQLLFLNTILLTAVPLTFSIVGVYIGFLLHKIQEIKYSEKGANNLC